MKEKKRREKEEEKFFICISFSWGFDANGGPTVEDHLNGDLVVWTLYYFYALFMFCLSPVWTARCPVGRIAAYVLFKYFYFVILLGLGFLAYLCHILLSLGFWAINTCL